MLPPSYQPFCCSGSNGLRHCLLHMSHMSPWRYSQLVEQEGMRKGEEKERGEEMGEREVKEEGEEKNEEKGKGGGEGRG